MFFIMVKHINGVRDMVDTFGCGSREWINIYVKLSGMVIILVLYAGDESIVIIYRPCKIMSLVCLI